MVHPIRMRILDSLRDEGASTATRLAALLGESSGATSYHLRVLAESGVIEEDDERGNGRERWWRRVTPLFFPTDAETPEDRALEVSARMLHIERDEEALRQFILGIDTLPPEWNAAAFTGSFPVYMTPEELMAFGMEWLARVESLRRAPENRPPGSRRVVVSLRAVPWVADE